MAATDSPRNTNKRGGWRWLGVFWLSVLSLTAIGGGVLQWLGPPGPSPREAQAREAHAREAQAREAQERPVPGLTLRAPPIDDAPVVVMARPTLVPPPVVGRDTPGPVADANPALLEPAGEGSKDNLPRIASDGRTPMQVYAAGFDQSSRRPRVSLLLAGIGPNEAESDAAIRALPGAVSLAVSPVRGGQRRQPEPVAGDRSHHRS